MEGLDFVITREVAHKKLIAYVSQGFLDPADLKHAVAANLRLEPLLVPVWVYKMTVASSWTAEVGEQTTVRENSAVRATKGKSKGRAAQASSSKTTVSWSARSGDRTDTFENLAVCAASGLWSTSVDALARARHEDSKVLVITDPDVAVVPIDRAPGSAKDAMFKFASSKAVAVGKALIPGALQRNVRFVPSLVSVDRKTVHVPIWRGRFSYQGRELSLFVDGVTGAASGAKPQTYKVPILFGGVTALLFALFMSCSTCFGGLSQVPPRAEPTPQAETTPPVVSAPEADLPPASTAPSGQPGSQP